MSLQLAAEFPDPVSAAIACGMLAENGIQSVTDGSTILSVLPMPSAIGGVRLMVNSDDLPRALELLEAHGDLNR